MVNRYPQQNVGIQHINCSLCFTGFFGQFLIVLKKIGGTRGRSCAYLFVKWIVVYKIELYEYAKMSYISFESNSKVENHYNYNTLWSIVHDPAL